MLCECWFVYVYFFFFKQKTAYEMRISDWSSDVCSSDLGSRSRTCQQRAGHCCAGQRRSRTAADSPRPVAALAFEFRTRCRRIPLFPGQHGSQRRYPQRVQYGTGSGFVERLHVLQLSGGRSEEHTSELQSLMRISYAVFFLKKKNRNQQ